MEVGAAMTGSMVLGAAMIGVFILALMALSLCAQYGIKRGLIMLATIMVTLGYLGTAVVLLVGS